MTPDTPFIPLTGGCKCGNTRFRMEVAPIITHCCHCRTCQRVSGSAFCTNTMIETAQLTVTAGEPELVQDRERRCGACRSLLWTHLPDLGPGIAIVGVGTLDEGERLSPEVHYFTRSKHPWITLPPHLPAFSELGDPGKPSANTRIMAVLAGDAGPSSL